MGKLINTQKLFAKIATKPVIGVSDEILGQADLCVNAEYWKSLLIFDNRGDLAEHVADLSLSDVLLVVVPPDGGEPFIVIYDDYIDGNVYCFPWEDL